MHNAIIKGKEKMQIFNLKDTEFCMFKERLQRILQVRIFPSMSIAHVVCTGTFFLLMKCLWLGLWGGAHTYQGSLKSRQNFRHGRFIPVLLTLQSVPHDTLCLLRVNQHQFCICLTRNDNMGKCDQKFIAGRSSIGVQSRLTCSAVLLRAIHLGFMKTPGSPVTELSDNVQVLNSLLF